MPEHFADFTVIEDCLSIRCGRPLKLPPKFTQHGGVADPTNMFFRTAPEDALILNGLVLAIRYTDAYSEESARIVRLKKAWSDKGIGYVHGFCELRTEHRQFRISRISEIVEPTTGEVCLDAVDYFNRLGLKETDALKRELWEDVRHGMCVLMALAVSDGILLQDEIESVVRYVEHRSEDFGVLLSDGDHRRIAQVAKLMRPDLDCARAAMIHVAADKRNVRRVASALRELSEADGSVCEAERAFLTSLGL